MRYNLAKIAVIAAILLRIAAPVGACDLCSVYSATQARGDAGRGFFIVMAEQFTHFGTMQENGRSIPNEARQFLDSSIAQLGIGYNVTDRFGFQLALPWLDRSFRRTRQFEIDEGTESGLGDMSLMAHALAFQHETRNATLRWIVTGGLKFPTGSTGRLREEVDETPPPPGAPESGIHGHDLTLGSGSVDGIIGTSAFGRWKKFFFNGNVQYVLRTKGDFDYRFANDLMWSGGPGFFPLLDERFTIALQAVVSGEYKSRDRFRGMIADDTGMTAVYMGPQMSVTWAEKLSAEIEVGIPVVRANTSVQIVPDYRLRGAVTWRF